MLSFTSSIELLPAIALSRSKKLLKDLEAKNHATDRSKPDLFQDDAQMMMMKQLKEGCLSMKMKWHMLVNISML